ncbi:hypothetical protein SAMN05444273_103509 [Litoreibacter ascidiaceicola]|uniref:DUF2147 domain-containing protein n=1 Tax=Litoreibacter ascidiaceicola TaxID=1486859 RepID=A0A1M4YDN7_9RHOB|nr:hypothetical protein [Litoreibacter ascidiaceicola]SHF03845.1 hypothetical protein SAMN05444273_103509 [Litoreibacter ascidiaceicola]
MKLFLLLACLICTSTTASAVALMPFGKDPERDTANRVGGWMVCGLKGSDSFLSLRRKPKTGSGEMMKLSPYTLVATTGKTSSNGTWAEIHQYRVLYTSDGVFMSEPEFAMTKVKGWVATRFLCHYGPLPNGD